jgi:hypothetical protein
MESELLLDLICVERAVTDDSRPGKKKTASSKL